MPNFNDLEIKNVIIHEIIRQTKQSEHKDPPIFSEIECSLNQKCQDFLRDRIIAAIGGNRGYDIVTPLASEYITYTIWLK